MLEEKLIEVNIQHTVAEDTADAVVVDAAVETAAEGTAVVAAAVAAGHSAVVVEVLEDWD